MNNRLDILKYYAPIRKFYMVKYKLSPTKIDMLLFLYSERYFDTEKYNEYKSLFPWNSANISDLLRDDWVMVFRKGIQFKTRTIYCLSRKANNMIVSLYRKLDGEEIPTEAYSNPLFLKNIPYTHRQYKNFIIKMNEYRRKKKLNDNLDLSGIYD